jgi:hypothetical protein
MGGCFFVLSILFFIIGLVQFFAPERSQPGTASASRMWSRVPVPQPEPAIPAAPSAASMGGKSTGMEKFPRKFDWIKVGERVYVQHPVKGELMAHVDGRIVYAELWQQTRGPQAPWVPTGNVFLGFWLEGGMFLLSWQNRVYLLDEAVDLSDADIQRDFAPHARKFAQSNQTAEVLFAWPPAMWHMDDIGKFRVDETEGEGLRFSQGAVGRFVHASGDSGRALVVEDYEGGGGGQDTAWVGYLIKEEQVKKA